MGMKLLVFVLLFIVSFIFYHLLAVSVKEKEEFLKGDREMQRLAHEYLLLMLKRNALFYLVGVLIVLAFSPLKWSLILAMAAIWFLLFCFRTCVWAKLFWGASFAIVAMGALAVYAVWEISWVGIVGGILFLLVVWLTFSLLYLVITKKN